MAVLPEDPEPFALTHVDPPSTRADQHKHPAVHGRIARVVDGGRGPRVLVRKVEAMIEGHLVGPAGVDQVDAERARVVGPERQQDLSCLPEIRDHQIGAVRQLGRTMFDVLAERRRHGLIQALRRRRSAGSRPAVASPAPGPG